MKKKEKKKKRKKKKKKRNNNRKGDKITPNVIFQDNQCICVK